MILDPGLELTLRPMKYPHFYDMYRNAIKNTWTVEEVDFSADVSDLQHKLSKSERHLIRRLVAFFATGDSIVSNNLVLNLYKHINSPEARLYMSRQLFEEALHVQFYLTLLDTYIPDHKEREEAFSAIHNIPSLKQKADFCFKWMDSINSLEKLDSKQNRKDFLMNLICYATCIEGLFFFAAFAYVYYLRSKGMLNGLATGTNWVFRDESAHIQYAYEVIRIVKEEEPDLWDNELEQRIIHMMDDAIECEMGFAVDLLEGGVAGLSSKDMRTYLQFIVDQRLIALGIPAQYGAKNPFDFMELQDAQELANFFERRVSAYQVAVSGSFSLSETF